MARRRTKWIWRRGGRQRLGVHSVIAVEGRAKGDLLAEPGTTPITIEQEAVQLLREWREMQDVMEGLGAETNRRQEEPFVAFGWEEPEATVRDRGAAGRMGVEGVRERLRGRGEV